MVCVLLSRTLRALCCGGRWQVMDWECMSVGARLWRLALGFLRNDRALEQGVVALSTSCALRLLRSLHERTELTKFFARFLVL